MATRRVQRRPMRRRFKRSPLRTRTTNETRWNTSRWVTVREFAFTGEQIQNVDMVVLSPRLMFEMTIQPDTVSGIPIRNIAPIINQMQALRGVKVGGIVWDSGFHCANPINDVSNDYVNAYARVYETLWSRRVVDESGIPSNAPDMNSTWRPLRVDDSVFDPTENSGDLVRIHHTRYALLGTGSNAFGQTDSDNETIGTLGAASASASTWTQPGWGGARSIRLRKFVPDDQQLSFNLVVTNPNPAATNQQTIVWTVAATVYWAMQNQR